MRLADIPVDWTLLREPPPTMEGGPDGQGGLMVFLIGLNDFPAFVQALAGTVETITLAGGSTVERVVPLQHPDNPLLFAVAYRTEFFGTPGGIGASVYTPQFSHARVFVDFATLPFGVGGDSPYYTFTEDYGVTIETIPDAGLTFTDGSKSTGDYGLPVTVIAYTLVTYMSLTPVSYAVASMVGKVNSAAFTVEGVGTFPIGTLRFDGARSEYAQGMYSRTRVKSFALKYRPRPWNQVLRKDGVWDTPTLGTSGIARFESANFEVLKTA